MPMYYAIFKLLHPLTPLFRPTLDARHAQVALRYRDTSDGELAEQARLLGVDPQKPDLDYRDIGFEIRRRRSERN
jgi:hypothetical protein